MIKERDAHLIVTMILLMLLLLLFEVDKSLSQRQVGAVCLRNLKRLDGKVGICYWWDVNPISIVLLRVRKFGMKNRKPSELWSFFGVLQLLQSSNSQQIFYFHLIMKLLSIFPSSPVLTSVNLMEFSCSHFEAISNVSAVFCWKRSIYFSSFIKSDLCEAFISILTSKPTCWTVFDSSSNVNS